MIFIDDVKREVFPGNGTFELYMNYTPCTLCCDLLFKLMETEKKRRATIYALSIYKAYEKGMIEKLKCLHTRILIRSMSQESRQLLFYRPSAILSAIATELIKKYLFDAIADALSAITTVLLANAGIDRHGWLE